MTRCAVDGLFYHGAVSVSSMCDEGLLLVFHASWMNGMHGCESHA
jgi:hypothetical protein